MQQLKKKHLSHSTGTVYLLDLSLPLPPDASSSPHARLSLSPVCHVAGISGQHPLVQNMTVTEGGTANLTCRVEYNDNTSLQWSNPAQQTLFFGDKKGELENVRQQQ